ncbi:MAG: trypsin-like peptidase domain-containing protein [Planctomycetota bacterium]
MLLAGLGGYLARPAAPTGFGAARSVSNAFEAVAEEIAPAVVRIEASVEFRGEERPLGQGSGVFVRADGTIVTNAHVVRGASSVRAALVDGRTFDAEILGVDSATDLAVLRVDGDGTFRAAALRAEEDARVGEWVLAVGNPLGLGHAVTAGIVSGRGRAAQIATYEDFIQTDAAINPGNSGGPLVDLDGRVVGINTAVADTRRGSQGIGFAIPADMVQSVVDQLLTSGRVQRGYLGVELRELEARSASRGERRVVVARAEPGTPARAAGVRAGDVIVTFEGREVENLKELMDRIAQVRPGREIRLGVLRGDATEVLRVEVAERPRALDER